MTDLDWAAEVIADVSYDGGDRVTMAPENWRARVRSVREGLAEVSRSFEVVPRGEQTGCFEPIAGGDLLCTRTAGHLGSHEQIIGDYGPAWATPQTPRAADDDSGRPPLTRSAATRMIDTLQRQVGELTNRCEALETHVDDLVDGDDFADLGKRIRSLELNVAGHEREVRGQLVGRTLRLETEVNRVMGTLGLSLIPMDVWLRSPAAEAACAEFERAMADLQEPLPGEEPAPDAWASARANWERFMEGQRDAGQRFAEQFAKIQAAAQPVKAERLREFAERMMNPSTPEDGDAAVAEAAMWVAEREVPSEPPPFLIPSVGVDTRTPSEIVHDALGGVLAEMEARGADLAPLVPDAIRRMHEAGCGVQNTGGTVCKFTPRHEGAHSWETAAAFSQRQAWERGAEREREKSIAETLARTKGAQRDPLAALPTVFGEQS